MSDMEGTHDNDNEELSFVSLAALTANVVRYLETDKQKEDATDKSSSSDEEEKRAIKRLEFVNRRLRDLQRFEDRAAGKRRR